MKIRTLEGLERAALSRQSVKVTNMPRPISAAFMMSIPARVILGYFKVGMSIYTKAQK